jgi:hypothetical protein
MSQLSFDADRAVLLLAGFLALFGAYECYAAIRKRKFVRAAFWGVGAIISALIALFLATFQIRLM